MANRFVQAKSFGGAFRSGQPRLIVVHSLEAPPRRGLAYDLATGWIQNAGVSPQHMTDPGETVDLLRPGIVGWHCGNGNQVSVGLEVTGRAAWSRDEWLESEAFAAVRLDAKQGAAVAAHYGIPMRWLSLAQIRNGESGFCTHNDISLTLGGTNHWDPGPNFPYAIFMQMVQQFAGGWDGIKDDSKPVTPDAPGTGGADPADWIEELMANVTEDQKALLLAGAQAAVDIKTLLVEHGNLQELMNRTYVLVDHSNKELTTERFDEVLTDVVNRLFVVQDHIDNPENIPKKA